MTWGMFTIMGMGTLNGLEKKLMQNFTVTSPYKNCVRYVQKRLGARLRKLKNEKKHEILSGRKNISGKGSLTYKIISKMQSFYGIAICQKLGQLHAMNKSIGTVF